ncbi:MAG: hypothetical protein H0T76_26885 [Nannocystis sp.]|nr:hypothetical protein [Nannocystis sp.]MBA3550120.1 hypothetical protein [Nannocystis sp.]
MTYTQRARSSFVTITMSLALIACPGAPAETAGSDSASSGPGTLTDPGTSATDPSSGGVPTTTAPQTGSTGDTLGTGTGVTTGTGELPGTTGTTGTTSDTTGMQQTGGTDTGDGVLDIAPENVLLEIVDGNIVMQPFTATYEGVDVTDKVTWSYTKPQIGAIMMAGLFVPTGTLAGKGELKATYDGAQDKTEVSVKIIKTLDPGAIAGGFGAPVGPDPTMTIVYPYDNTVFPLKVVAPIVQWNGAQNNDQYKLHISEQFYDYTIYFTTNAPARHLIDELEWIAISESGQGAKSDPIAFELQRKSGNNTYEAVKQTWRMAQARLPGRVYYWELPSACNNGANGRILSIKPTEAKAEEFFNANGQCWGCHSVSRDGRTVSSVFDTGQPFPLATIDVSVEPAVYGAIKPQAGFGGTFSAFNHDGTKLLLSDNTGGNAGSTVLKVIDTMTKQVLNPDVLGPGCGEPAWSPDGTKIAATCGYGGFGWTFDASNGDLVIADVNPDGVTISNKKILVPKLGEVGRPAYPNFSPGNEWVVFGRPTQGSRSTGNGQLWMIGVDGQNLVKLEKASNDNKSFNPSFAPLRAGGYYWVVFMSRRDYGNTLVGANRQQLWMTAISDPPTNGDPSNPPFYLRGQEDCALSENAFFAPDPCIEEENKSCESGIDCCSGHCIQMGEVKVCGEKGSCSEIGNACEVDADCCDEGSPCVDGYCQEIFPQ